MQEWKVSGYTEILSSSGSLVNRERIGQIFNVRVSCQRHITMQLIERNISMKSPVNIRRLEIRLQTLKKVVKCDCPIKPGSEGKRLLEQNVLLI